VPSLASSETVLRRYIRGGGTLFVDSRGEQDFPYLLPRWMLWGHLPTIAIIALHILDPRCYGPKVSVEAGVFPSFRTLAQIPDKMVDK
jgi:hypothetical protein